MSPATGTRTPTEQSVTPTDTTVPTAATGTAGPTDTAKTTGPTVAAGTAEAVAEAVADAVSTPRKAAAAGAPRAPHGGAAAARATGRRAVRLLRTAAVKSVAVLGLLLLWETAPRLDLVDRTFLPPFSEIATAWWQLAADGQLAENAGASLTRSFSGFGIAVAVAVPLGLLIGWYKPVANVLGPLLELFRNTAALALLPVFVLLLGIGETSKISIVVYACTWPILLNTISAVRHVDPTLLRLAKSMDLSAPRLFQKVILPASVPVVFTGIRLAGAVSILVLVAAEMIGAKAGLGYLINASQYNFAIPQMYAGIITISAIGVAFNQLLVAVERRLSSWRLPA
ncbi:ABC transporter permease [Streptomyces sp. NPDC054861]